MRFSDNVEMTAANMAGTDILAGTDVSANADKKFSLAGLGDWFLNRFNGLSLAGADQSVKSAIDSLKAAVGSPLVANTAAAMTDTTKVYVYTGSETGYTSGNWYYYDGTSWVPGGVYNSTAFETDKTLTVHGMAADAKIVGDAVRVNNGVSQFDYEYGDFVFSDSVYAATTTTPYYHGVVYGYIEFDFLNSEDVYFGVVSSSGKFIGSIVSNYRIREITANTSTTTQIQSNVLNYTHTEYAKDNLVHHIKIVYYDRTVTMYYDGAINKQFTLPESYTIAGTAILNYALTSGIITNLKTSEYVNDVVSSIKPIIGDLNNHNTIIPVLNTSVKLRFIGDSLVAGLGSSDYSLTGDYMMEWHNIQRYENVGVKCWVGQMMQYLSSKYGITDTKNRGIGGLSTQGLLDNLSMLIASADYVVVMIGTNDAANITTLYNNLTTIIQTLKGWNVGMSVMTNIPSIDTTGYNYSHVKGSIAKACVDNNIPVLDMYSLYELYCLAKGITIASTLNADGIHPNDTGYEIMFEIAKYLLHV